MNLAKLLVRKGLVSDAQVEESLESGKEAGYGVSESLVALGYVTESQIIDLLMREYGVPAMDIDGYEADEAVLKLVPRETALEKFLVPVILEGADLTIAVSDPSNILMLDDLGFITGKNIKPVVASERSIREKLEKFYGSADGTAVSRPDEEASVDSPLADVPDRDLYAPSGTSVPYEDTVVEPGRHESELSYSPNSASGLESDSAATGSSAEVEPQLEHSVDSPAIEHADHDDADTEFPKNMSPNPALSEEGEGEDSLEAENEIAGGMSLPSEEDDSGQSADTPSGGYAVRVEEVRAPEHEENREPQGPVNTTVGEGRTVLIVEVSPTVRKIMTMTLERAGYRVQAASDGMQALARINETIPDLVFVDIRLPHMDGYQLCKVIKSHGLTKSVPVILVSGKTGVLDKMKVRMAGASDMISKPFSAGVLVETAGRHAG